MNSPRPPCRAMYLSSNFRSQIYSTLQPFCCRSGPTPTLAFFLQSQAREMDREWCCAVRAELSIKSHIADARDLTRQYEHNFNWFEDDWGYHRMHTLEVLMHVNSNDNSIILNKF